MTLQLIVAGASVGALLVGSAALWQARESRLQSQDAALAAKKAAKKAARIEALVRAKAEAWQEGKESRQ